jgi:NADPH:quinone reductase-like Zn-dependent oxidoreductase
MSLPAQTRSWTTNLDGIPSLTLTTTPTPTPSSLAPGEVLVQTLAVSLNYKDAEIISGQFKHHKSSVAPPNLIPCADSVGVVVAVGPPLPNPPSHASTFVPGDRVLSVAYPLYATGPALPEYLAAGVGSAVNGVLTESRVFPVSGLVHCPKHLTDVEACTLPVAGTTAWMALRWNVPIVPAGESVSRVEPLPSPSPQNGDDSQPSQDLRPTVLLQGTGGVSLFGLQFARALGYRPLLTSSSAAKLTRAQSLLSTSSPPLLNSDTLDYTLTPNWSTSVLQLTSNRGADIIFENGGAATTPQSFSCVAFGGVIASIGYVGGKVDKLEGLPEGDEGRLNINVLALKRNVTIKGMLNGPRDRLEEMLRFVEEKQIRPVVDRVFGFEEAREALSYLWEGRHFGKVVIRVAER